MTEKKIQEIKELIEKAQVQIELFQAIQIREKSFIHKDAICVLVNSKYFLTKYLEELTGKEVWTCCGGKVLDYDENCPICGSKYEGDIYEDQ